MQRTITGRIVSRSIYGIIITTALLATLEHTTSNAWQIALSIATSLLSISIAEAYADSIGDRINKKRTLGDEEHHEIIKESLYVFGGSTIPILSFVVSGFGIWSLEEAFLIAKVSAVVLLFEYGYFYGRSSGKSRLNAIKVGALNVLLVALIIAFKEFVHV